MPAPAGREAVEQTPLQAYAPEIAVNAAGRLWRLTRAADLEQLWDAMTDDPRNFEDERLPYWTELWPSSVALAGWLAERREEIAGRACLDLGCGLGLTALVGQWLGARVTAVDYEEDALRFARLNADRNAVAQPCWTVMDWRRPAVRARSMARIWGGDIMYEKRFVAPVLPRTARPGWPSRGARSMRLFCTPCTAAAGRGGASTRHGWSPFTPSLCR